MSSTTQTSADCTYFLIRITGTRSGQPKNHSNHNTKEMNPRNTLSSCKESAFASTNQSLKCMVHVECYEKPGESNFQMLAGA
ncbi:hypothetical protein DITRI_Ditri05aG0014400 [Diplodiscus trichospermus]